MDLPETARIFAERFCPGPVTLVVPDGNHYTFGVRIPDHPFIYRFLTVYEKPLASTSVNLSGVSAALSVDEAFSTMDGTPDLAVDGGILPADSKVSTVILVNADSSWKILRNGPVTEDELKNALR